MYLWQKKPLGMQELVSGLQCQENGKEPSPIALEPGPEPRRAKQEARNQKRAQGRGEVGSGAGPGAQAGPSAKRAVHLRRGPEGEGSRDGPGPRGDASSFLAEPVSQVRVGCLCGSWEMGRRVWTAVVGPLARLRASAAHNLTMNRLRLRNSSGYHR